MGQNSSGDKTEKATPKKRGDARKEGQVLKSNDAVIAFGMIITVGALSLFGPYMIDSLQKFMISTFTQQAPTVFDAGSLMPFLSNTLLSVLLTILPILGAAAVAAIIINYAQVGFLFSTKAIQPKLSKISMISGFKRLFSSRSLVELLKSVIKLAILGYIAYNEYQAQIIKIQSLLGMTIPDGAAVIADILLSVAIKFAVVLAIMAPVDYLYQRWRHEKDLMMTKQEIKDEYKQTEGDPQIKGKIKQKQREMSAARMMAAMPDADVVITNPTHYAVALSYQEGQHTAPVIIAKGKDHVAKRIREAAAEHRIEMVENKPLAQYLYFHCELGDEVPEEMYQAVAEILAYIYRIKEGPQRART